MAHTSFPLKYRPSKLAAVVGQKNIVAQIRAMIANDSLPPTIGLCGLPGTGKTTLARLIAMLVNCTNAQDGEPCGKCDSCIAVKAGNSVDVSEMNAANDRGIETIRSLANRMRNLPRFGKRRFFILDEAHALTSAAFQAALKLFEEPPPKSVVIVCTSEPQALPVAIQQRLDLLQLRPVAPEVLVKRLLAPVCKKEGIDVPDDLLLRIAEESDATPRVALRILEQVSRVIATFGDEVSPSEYKLAVRNAIVAVGYTSPQRSATAMMQSLNGGNLAAFFKGVSAMDRPDQILAHCLTMLVEAVKVKLGAGGSKSMSGGLETMFESVLAINALAQRTEEAISLILRNGIGHPANSTIILAWASDLAVLSSPIGNEKAVTRRKV